MLQELERAQRLTEEELMARAEQRLMVILRHAAATVPFYKETYRRLGLAPNGVRSVADLRQLTGTG